MCIHVCDVCIHAADEHGAQKQNSDMRKCAHRMAARLDKSTQEAHGRYTRFTADESRILGDLQTIDNRSPVPSASSAEHDQADVPVATAADTEAPVAAAEGDSAADALGSNSDDDDTAAAAS